VISGALHARALARGKRRPATRTAPRVRDYLALPPRIVAPPALLAEVMQAAVEQLGVTVNDLKSPRRYDQIAGPRQIAMYLAREMTGRSFTEIGAAFGGRDHSTAVYAHQVIGFRREQRRDVRDAVDATRAAVERRIHDRVGTLVTPPSIYIGASA